ncbi:cytochrome b/b6 domain-containing protein [Acidiferrimicrobium sp. IK]|uniref:cytochrome b/b6 domain-containing protein n=1 Tax=Acidiferrimicrobium sp. IK TaxID=2871700 RepID=UPI0021CB515D|nr:cytochrome b/b6 domain-containing protein [Acidiferrimicrobium sp. IK]MCU4185839.1 cytochrome b/b6 domain-containing protein [Acidiferrimicrobium sp. IK]
MAETIRQRADPAAGDTPVERFDRAERAVHWANAAVFGVLIVTAAALYFSPLMALVGRRRLVEDIHLGAGLAAPIPLLAGLASRRYRADLRRFNRWSVDDRVWLRLALAGRRSRTAGRATLLDGKFNAGQKLNAAFTAGVVAVMLATGVIMFWFHPWPLSWRTGATYTHDWLAAAVVAVVAGHVTYAVRDPEALRSMWRGTVSRRWARAHARGWLQEVDDGAE